MRSISVPIPEEYEETAGPVVRPVRPNVLPSRRESNIELIYVSALK